jgi:hypothetical protein
MFYRSVFLCLATFSISKVFEVGRLHVNFYVFDSLGLGTYNLKVHKNENIFGSDFEICVFS